jgi:hypothetical protein
MITATPALVHEILDAHGGAQRWRTFTQVSAQIVTGGFLWGMKGVPIDGTPRRMTSTFRRQQTRTEPFGEAGWHMVYTPERVAVLTEDGTVVAAQHQPRNTFAGHVWDTPWTPLQLAYFNGYAMWTYYNLPFLLAEPSVQSSELASITMDGQRLRGLRLHFDPQIHTHSERQDLYFTDAGLLRRHDYQVTVAGGGWATHLVSGYASVQGLMFPTRRRVYLRAADGSFDTTKTVVSVDLSGFELQ